MSSYKVINSTVSLLYCARCANEFLEVHPEGRIICTDCGMTTTLDPQLVRVGQIQGTKYKMRDNRRYSFRGLVDEGREDAFSEVYVPSPEPGRRPIGWKDQLRTEDMDGAVENDGRSNGHEKPKGHAYDGPKLASEQENSIHVAGVDDQPRKGWRNDSVMDIITEEVLTDDHVDTPASE